MSESSAVSPESVNKNTPESPKNKVKKKKSLWKILLAIILILVVLVCLLLCGVRAYFRLSVREYYKNSEKTFEIPEELCNGNDIVKVSFRLLVDNLIDSRLVQLYPISIVKQILKQEEI